MKAPASSLIALCFAVTLPNYAAETADAKGLKYRFVPGQTNAYQVTIESTTPEDPVTLTGVLFVNSRKVTDGVAAVGLSGSLTPKGQRGPMRSFPGRYGPAQPFLRPMGFQPNYEVSVDELGHVLREPSTTPRLPTPLDGLPEVLFPPLPALGKTGWQASAALWIEGDIPPMGGGDPPGYIGTYYPGGPQALLAATRTVTAKLRETTANSVTITKRIEVESRLKSGNEPRLRATAEGEVEFDREQGRLHSLELRCNSTLTTETLTQRRPFVLTARLLESDELAKVLKAQYQRPEPPPPVGAEELAKRVADLQTDDHSTRQEAMNRLEMAKIESPTPEFLAALVKLTGDADVNVRNEAMQLLGKYGTAEQLTAMLRLLKAAEQVSQHDLLDGLRRIGDPRAIEPLADLIARGSYNADYATEVLGNFGPAAEAAALELLKQKHAETRRRACTVLARVGSAKCLNALKTQMLDEDPQVSNAATDAARAVRARCGEEGG